MSFFNLIDQISFKKLIGLSFLFAILIAIPLTVFVVQQQTKLQSEAYFEKPKPIVPSKKYGSPPEGNPQITLVWPFLGKVGDAVLIEGRNFGNNPVDKSLKIGNKQVPEEYINKWTPTLIEFMIPEGAKSNRVNLSVTGRGANWTFPFTVYSIDTQIQVTENNDIVKVLKGPAEGKIIIFFRDNSQQESRKFSGTIVPHDKTIISVKVLDKNNQPVPFFVEPEEFGF